jgi:alkanesulfonate monooxygenase SsuD/methylene tetrahydromethanopterin reductase-like flavin-dependent oxidoreductase (luciferase family)
MRIGLIVPQGYFNEFDGWHPQKAWERIVHVAQKAEQLGFDSLWCGEHVLSKWESAPAFDGLTMMTALAARVPRVQLGFVVLNSMFRNPAMTAKAAATLDAISGSRLILGLGAGFKENEAVAFGFPYPPMQERLAMLAEHFEIISRMTRAAEPPFTFEGQYARVVDVAHAPRTGGGDHIPLLIAGHGKNVTFRLAARYCDQLDLDAAAGDWVEYRDVVYERCSEIGRDPATLPLSTGTNASWPYRELKVIGSQRMMKPEDLPGVMSHFDLSKLGTRAEELATFRELGVARMECGVPGLVDTDEGLYELMEDCRTAGITMGQPSEVLT